MKIKHAAILLAFSSIGLFSCDNDKKDSNTTVTTTKTAVPVNTVAERASKEGTAVVVTSDRVPENIRTSFTAKYPTLDKVEWYTYKPSADDTYDFDDEYYYVRYSDNGMDTYSWFDNGQWVVISPTVTTTPTANTGNKDLPDAVNQYINTNYAGYSIEEVNKENDKNVDLFEIKLNKDGNKVTIKILPTGEIFKEKIK